MQPYTATDAEVLTARQVEVDFGLDLLDTADQLLADASEYLVGGKVERNNYAGVHGTVELDLLAELDWSNVRVRPWQAVTAPAGTVRRNLGVYVLTTPERVVTDDDTQAWSVQGYDKLHLLQRIVGDTYVVPAGTLYLDAAQQAITDAGVTGLPALFDGTAVDVSLAEPMVWVLDESDPATWLRIVNDLLSAIGYRGLWADQDGRYRSEPYQSPAARPPEWTFDVADPQTNIVGPTRKLSADAWAGFNWWRFVRDGMTTAPAEGAGLYTVDRTGGGLRHGRVERLQVANQTALEARAAQIVDADTRRTQLLDVETGPLPILGHFDLATLFDPVLGSLRVLTRSHTIPLDGGNVALSLEVV